MSDNLQALNIDFEYRSDTQDIVQEFYIPCLSVAREYYRAVGYFTSDSLELVARGLEALIKKGGRMFLVASPFMKKEDIEALEEGYSKREDIISQSLANQIPDLLNDSEVISARRWECLSWMIANGNLEVKIAVPRNSNCDFGIYHEKIGLFQDSKGDRIAFSGSANETAGGLVNNFESIDVYRSWVETDRVQRKWNNFQKLWSNTTDNLEIFSFPKACKEKLIRLAPDTAPTIYISDSGHSMATEGPDIPYGLTLRDYQKEAINNWFSNNGRGTLKMATGSGKTIIALSAILRLVKKIQLQVAIVVCPFRHLVTQWDEEARNFGFNPILAFQSRARWDGLLNSRLYNIDSDKSEFLIIITTNRTFADSAFQSKLKYLPQKTIIVADEAHNLGAARLRTCLPDHVRFRLALSATPERWFDEEGTEAIFDYFGEILEPEFTLKDALKAGALVPYRYYPILVELTEDELEVYLDLSAKIAKAFADSDDDESNDRLTVLLMQRARLIATVKNKMVKLRELMIAKQEEDHMLIYCGDGKVEVKGDVEIHRHVEAVCKLLGRDLSIRVAPFTAETSMDDRKVRIQQLDQGILQGLVAIRCLDEGVDIPSIKTAVILASSGNPRQFIQRRGRILRRSPGKDAAEIYDMIVIPPKETTNSESERNLLKKELRRFVEFADLAQNSGTARAEILELQSQFGLLDI